MSQPTFPQPTNLTREEAINQILSSIAMEELGLSHVFNAEGEKIQYVLGTLSGAAPDTPATIDQVLQVNDSVQQTLQQAASNQLLLNAKMSAALNAPIVPGATGPTGPMGPEGPAGGATGPAGPAGPTGADGVQGSTGPTGPAGPAGTIIASFPTLDYFTSSVTTGTTGDYYIVGNDLYVWDPTTNAFVDVGQIVGPAGTQGIQGPTGPAGPGGTIIASFASTGSLPATGALGDYYLVGNDLYVWDPNANAFVNVGSIAGPSGPTGATGPTGPAGAVGTIVGSFATTGSLPAVGTATEYYIVGPDLYGWDPNTSSWVDLGPIQGPTGPAGSSAIIPFASGIPVDLAYALGGAAGIGSFVGFGLSGPGLSVFGSNVSLVTSGPAINYAFVVPRAGHITGFSAQFTAAAGLSVSLGTAYVQAQLLYAPAGSETFTPITTLTLSPGIGLIALLAPMTGTNNTLNIAVNPGDQLLLEFGAYNDSIASLAGDVVGFASAGVAISS